MADWSRVQGGGDVTAANSSITLSAIGSGNTICAGCVIDTGKTVILSDNTGANTYDAFPSDDDGTLAVFVFKPRNRITNAPTTFTWTFSPAGAPTNFEKVVDEFTLPTGKSAISFDGGQVALSNSGTFTGLAATDTPVFQNLQSDVLIWGFGVVGASTTITTGAGFNAGSTAGGGASATILSEWKIQSTASTSNKLSFASQSGTMWAGVMAIAPVAATSWVPIQNVQHWPPGSTSTSWSASFPKATTKGSVLVGEYFPNSGNFSQLLTFTDNNGKNYLPNCLTPQPSGRSIFWSGGLNASTPQTFSGTLSVADAIGLFVTEFLPPPNTGSVAIDGGGVVDVSTLANAATTVSTPNITTTKNFDLIYSSVEPAGHNGCVPLNGITVVNGQGRSLGNGYLIQSTAGAIAATWDIASGATNLTMFQLAISTTPVFGGQRIHLGLDLAI